MHPLRHLEDLALYLAAKGAVATFTLLPYRVAAPLARSLGRIWFRLASRDAHTAVEQLMTIGHLESRAEATRLARAVFARMGEEVVAWLHLAQNPSRLASQVTLHGGEHLDAALRGGRGAVWLTGHLGNWELMGAAIARLGYPLHAIVDPLHYPRAQTVLDERRLRHGIRCLIRGRDTSRKDLVRHLAHGHLLGVLVDQCSNTWGASLPFLGRPAHTPVVPAMVALEAGAPILVGFMERLGPLAYRIRILPPIEAPTGKGSLFDRACAIMTKVNEILGAAIQADPAAWPWFHRRWGVHRGNR